MSGSESPGGSDVSDAIKKEVDNWSSNTTEALDIFLFRGGDEIAQFGPQFTYPIFGEEEAVFGYQGLSIELSFASHDLKLHAEISWDKKWAQQGEIKASDVRGDLEEFLPPSALDKESQPAPLSDAAAKFVPPGERIHSYKVGADAFEIWRASLADPVAKEMMVNAQILVPLFIEGGQELELDDDRVNERWNVFLLYQVLEKASGKSPYSLVGFSTSYRVFTFPDRRNPSAASLALFDYASPDADSVVNSLGLEGVNRTKVLNSPLDLPSRERISQFLILPPYQRSGHGPQLYNTMYKHLIAPENVLELTVEDPNEAFDDMRDACDVVRLREDNHDFASLLINSKVDTSKLKPTVEIPVGDIVDGAVTSRIKQASKIMPRQLARLIEMQTLSKIPQNHRSVNRISRKEKSSNDMDRSYFYWRLLVKERLYVANRSTLDQLDREDRIDKLEATVDNVQEDYARLLALADNLARRQSKDHVVPQNEARKNNKRKHIIESDDDQEGDDSIAVADEDDDSTGPKKKRMAVR